MYLKVGAGAGGGVVFLIIVVAAFLMIRRNKHSKNSDWGSPLDDRQGEAGSNNRVNFGYFSDRDSGLGDVENFKEITEMQPPQYVNHNANIDSAMEISSL